ncbi:uncharacterized protein LOC123514988 [Portunus trituberculatus]|uniref:uncharacterized protein LOC123514988 n=1 Tax=Portunus trituberculatus TaxID=210409 RepID=UPI001E1D06C3|nr:uncharacterized protein LOC123514988 [Portunus trituberculatus]
MPTLHQCELLLQLTNSVLAVEATVRVVQSLACTATVGSCQRKIRVSRLKASSKTLSTMSVCGSDTGSRKEKVKSLRTQEISRREAEQMNTKFEIKPTKACKNQTVKERHATSE